MKTVKLYTLKNKNNKVIYVGVSVNLKARLRQHTKMKPQEGFRFYGKFYGQDLTIHMVDEYDTRKEAMKAERELKEHYGFEITELIGSSSRIGLTNPNAGIALKKLSTTKIKCKHCAKEMNPGNFAQYHGDKCKLK